MERSTVENLVSHLRLRTALRESTRKVGSLFEQELRILMKQWKLVAVPAGCLFVMISLIHSQSGPNVDWPVVNGGPGGPHYSALKQIDASNVNQLKVAWTYDAGDARDTLETNPIEVNGVLYGYTAGQRVFAVNAE